jgi:phosphopantetheinyl transferase
MWTRKEAVLKASGEGLVVPMTSVIVAAPPYGARVRDVPADDGYVAAVAELPPASSR